MSLYTTPRWRALREEKLAKNPICEICGGYQDLEIHHVNPVTKEQLEDNDEAALYPPLSKMVTLCTSDHAKLTRSVPAREITASQEWDAFLSGE